MTKANTINSDFLFIYYIISFLEGSALMATEIVAAKLIAPYFGMSIYVWTAVLAATLGGLALGYYAGGILSQKMPHKKLSLILLFSTIYMLLLPFFGRFIMESFMPLPIKPAVSLSMLLILSPIMFAFGMVSPIIIAILSLKNSNTGSSVAAVYTISTMGGVLATLFFNLFLIFKVGILLSLNLLLIFF